MAVAPVGHGVVSNGGGEVGPAVVAVRTDGREGSFRRRAALWARMAAAGARVE